MVILKGAAGESKSGTPGGNPKLRSLIKDPEMRYSWIFRVGLKCHDRLFYRREEEKRGV